MGRFRSLSFVHPELFHFGRVVLPTYGFLLAVGTILALLLCVRNARTLALDTDKIWTMALLVIVTLLVTSKMMLAFVHWRQYGARALGMSLYGTQDPAVTMSSSVLACVVAVVYGLRRKLPLLRTADAFAPSMALGGSILCVACFEAGCGYGTPTGLPWAIVFRTRGAQPGVPLGVPLHPTQLYESLAAFAILILLQYVLHAPHRDGEVLGACLFLGGMANAALAPLRGDTGLWLAGWLPATQLFSFAMVLSAGFLWVLRPQAAPVLPNA